MKKNFLLVAVGVLCGIMPIFAQVSQQTQTGTTKKAGKENPADILFTAVLLDLPEFPAEQFSPTNSDQYMSALRNWIGANESAYRQMLSSREIGLPHTVIYNGDFARLHEDDQAAIKGLFNEADPFIKLQAAYYTDKENIFLFSKAQYLYLQTLLK